MKVLNKNELQDDASIYVVIGSVGVGKTSLVNSHKGKKLVLSFDASYSTLKATDDLTVVSDITSQELLNTQKFLADLTKLSQGYDLVVFDNVSALSENMIYDLTQGLAGSNRDGRAAYKNVQDVLHGISNWSLTFKGDVLFTAWSKLVDGFETAQLNETAFNKFAGFAKVVGRAYVNKEYYVQLQPSLEGLAKNRVNKLEKTLNSKFWDAVQYREGDSE